MEEQFYLAGILYVSWTYKGCKFQAPKSYVDIFGKESLHEETEQFCESEDLAWPDGVTVPIV